MKYHTGQILASVFLFLFACFCGVATLVFALAHFSP